MSSNGNMDFFPDRIRPLVDRMIRALAVLSFGHLSADHANLSLIIRK